MTVKLAGQQSITDLTAVMDAVARHAGTRLDGSEAYRLCLDLPGKAKRTPPRAQAYLLRSIEMTPMEVQKFIDTELIA